MALTWYAPDVPAGKMQVVVRTTLVQHLMIPLLVLLCGFTEELVDRELVTTWYQYLVLVRRT